MNSDRNNEQDESIIKFFEENNIIYEKNYLFVMGFVKVEPIDYFIRAITFRFMPLHYIVLFEKDEIKFYGFKAFKFHPNPELIIKKSEIAEIKLTNNNFLGKLKIFTKSSEEKIKTYDFKVIVGNRKWTKENLEYLRNSEWSSKMI